MATTTSGTLPQGPTYNTSPGSSEPANITAANEAYLYSVLAATGEYTNAQIAGVLGNIQQESGFNPEAIEPNGVGHGLAQWSLGGRWVVGGMTGNNAQDMQFQANLLLSELAKNYNGSNTALKAATTVQQAAQVFSSLYEQDSVYGARTTNAENILSDINSGKLVAQPMASLKAYVDSLASNPSGASAEGAATPEGVTGDIATAVVGALGINTSFFSEITSSAFWNRIALFAGGLVLFLLGFFGFVGTTKTGQEAITTAAEVAPK